MILSALQVTSFGALASVAVELKPGLNVILGPNEAGKSTLFKALQHLLLTPVKPNKKTFQEQIEPLLPVGGADTISCALEFSLGGERFRLEKSWGARTAAELQLPDGSRLGEAEAVEAHLLKLLPVQPGTLRTVLLTRQSGLTTTLEELRRDEETVYGLSDLLHRSVLETDGVSVGRFQELLERHYQDYLKHWDLQRQRPERKRGGEARWSRERGSVLECYYNLEDLESRYREVREKEAALEELNGRLESCVRELAAKEEELRSIEPGAKDAEKRGVLEVELKETELFLKEARAHYESWTKDLPRRETMQGELPELEKSLRDLELERKKAQTFLERKNLLERFRRIQASRERLRKAEEQLASVLPLPNEQLDRLRKSAAEIEGLQAALKAGNLSMIFRARKAVDLVTRRDMEEPSERHLPAGKSLTVEAAGKIEMRHPDWSLEVCSGKAEVEKIAEQFEQVRSAHDLLLEKLKVSSVEEAVEANRRYEERRSEVRTVKAVYEQELGEDTFETLEAASGTNSDSPSPRELSQVLEELADKKNRLQNIRSELEEVHRALESLEERYGDREKLFARVAELGGIKREIEQKTSGLAPLPEGYPESRSLLEHHNKLKEEIQYLRQQRVRLETECRNAEASLPEESSEDAAQLLEDVRERFNSGLKKAEILVRIRRVAGELLEELDRGIYEPFTKLVSSYLAALSNNRYRNVPATEALPDGVIRGDGQALAYELLSEGTKDLFSLALRLAMAEFFLGQREGFLILDDPLVDLDPERQQRAAAVLAEFACKRQLVVFTCQPAHAALLGDSHRIELERT